SGPFPSAAPLRDREQAGIGDLGCAPARLRLLAEGVPSLGPGRRATLRRDAPLRADLRELAGCTRHRDARHTPPAHAWEVQLRNRTHAQGRARPAGREVPVIVLDEADLRVRRIR